MSNKHSGLITPITNYEDLTDLETEVQSLRVEMILKLTEIDNHLFTLDGHIMRLHRENEMLSNRLDSLLDNIQPPTSHIVFDRIVVIYLMVMIILYYYQ